MPEDLTEFFRIINLTLGIVTLVWLIVRRVRSKDLYATSLRNDIWLLAVYWDASMVVGTVEQLFETGTTVRVVLYFAAVLVTLRILMRNKDWEGFATRGG
jgi:nitrate reductase gamma subunit